MPDIAWYIVFGAYVLDFMVGDPRWLPHPVVYMGRAISFFERVFRKIIKAPLVSGAFFAVFLIATTWSIAWGIVALAAMIHPVVSDVVQVVMLFFCFSSKSLEDAAMAVFQALKEKDMKKARHRVGMIVGRTTDSLDEAGVTRATVETVAENFVDGFLSPLFFALIGGAPLAMAYKMINTLDSMVGYKNDTYILFGRVAARIDDAANFVPARFSVPIIFLAALLVSPRHARHALKTGVTQGRRHKSPNAGFPEATFAGALGVRLGGPNVYHGKLVEKPFIGEQFADPRNEAINKACSLMAAGSFTAVILSCLMLSIW